MHANQQITSRDELASLHAKCLQISCIQRTLKSRSENKNIEKEWARSKSLEFGKSSSNNLKSFSYMNQARQFGARL